jgi:hypothetical protein
MLQDDPTSSRFATPAELPNRQKVWIPFKEMDVTEPVFHDGYNDNQGLYHCWLLATEQWYQEKGLALPTSIIPTMPKSSPSHGL